MSRWMRDSACWKQLWSPCAKDDLLPSRQLQNETAQLYRCHPLEETFMPEFTLRINGQERKVTVAPDTPLLWVLRDTLNLTGTKFGCGAGLCGACTIHMDGKATRSCITAVSAASN